MRSMRIRRSIGTRTTRLFSYGLTALTLSTMGIITVPDAGAAPPQVTTKVSIVVDDVFCPAPFNAPPCKGYGVHLVPDQIPIGPVEFTLLDRRPESTRTGTLSVFINGAGFSIGDGGSFTDHLSGDGSTLTVNATTTASGQNVHIANSALSPQPYFSHTGFFDVIPTGYPYPTATHVDIVVDSDGNGLATVTPSSAPNGLIEVFVIDHRTNPLDWGPLHVWTSTGNLPIDITAPTGEVCGVTVICPQTIVSSATLSNQTILVQAPSIGGPPAFFDVGYLSTSRPTLASNDDVKDVSMELTSLLLATEREMRVLETTGDPYTTYVHLSSGNSNIRFDNQSGTTHTCSIPGYVNSFTLGGSSNITKHVALHTAGVTLTAQCTAGSSTKYFGILVK